MSTAGTMLAAALLAAWVVTVPIAAHAGVGHEPAQVPGVLDLPEVCDDAEDDRFDDVDPDGTHAEAIDCVAHLGITLGVDEQRFAPDETVVRGQMASFLVRLLTEVDLRELPDGDVEFHDAEDAQAPEHLDNAQRLAAAEIVLGVDEVGDQPVYGFADPVNRGAMASFLVRASEWAVEMDLPEWPHELPFTDVDDDNPHAEAIEKAYANGVTGGTTATTYEPWAELTRAQMATFLARTITLLTEQLAFEPGEPAALSLTAGDAQPPGDVEAGEVFDPPVVVQVVDVDGEPVAEQGVQVTVQLRDETGEQVFGGLGGTLTRTTDADGLAHFDGLRVRAQVAPGPYALGAVAQDLSGDEAAFEVLE